MAEAISSSMFKKLKDFLIRRKTADITPAEAYKIQTASYVLNHTEVKKKYSPTYLGIALGLDSEEKQVFEGAVYYLVRLACNKPKYKEAILEIFYKKLNEKKLNQEFKEYLKQQMKDIC